MQTSIKKSRPDAREYRRASCATATLKKLTAFGSSRTDLYLFPASLGAESTTANPVSQLVIVGTKEDGLAAQCPTVRGNRVRGTCAVKDWNNP